MTLQTKVMLKVTERWFIPAGQNQRGLEFGNSNYSVKTNVEIIFSIQLSIIAAVVSILTSRNLNFIIKHLAYCTAHILYSSLPSEGTCIHVQ